MIIEELNPVNVVAAYNGKFILLSAGGKSKVGYSEN